MNKNIYTSAIYSITLQIIIGIISIFGLFIKMKSEDLILNELLLLETIVQFVEFTFYIWLIYNFSKINFNVTLVRYIDWFITTPTMLFTIIAFMIYRNNMSDNSNTKKYRVTLDDIISENSLNLLYVFIANAFMLILGFLGEYNAINRILAFLTSSLFLFVSFYIIYKNYVLDDKLNKIVFWFNFIIWSGYGIAYLYPITTKNIAYNILDIFSKNINGLLLTIYILFLYAPSNRLVSLI
jgi:hypothetical protein